MTNLSYTNKIRTRLDARLQSPLQECSKGFKETKPRRSKACIERVPECGLIAVKINIKVRLHLSRAEDAALPQLNVCSGLSMKRFSFNFWVKCVKGRKLFTLAPMTQENILMPLPGCRSIKTPVDYRQYDSWLRQSEKWILIGFSNWHEGFTFTFDLHNCWTE